TGGCVRRSARARLAGGFVHGLGQLVACLGQLVGGGIQLVGVAIGHGFLGFFDCRFDVLGFGIADLRAVLLERLLHVVDHGVGAVARFDLIPLLAVVGGVRFGVLGHLVYFVLGQSGRRGDGDLLL